MIHRRSDRDSFWTHLAILGLVGCGAMAVASGLGYMRLNRAPDSGSYLDFDWSSLRSALSGIRTPAYPAFLWICQRCTSLENIPYLHGAALIASVMLLYWGLRSLGCRPMAALFTSLPLMGSRALAPLASELLADSLAMSLAIGSSAAFLTTLGPDRRWWHWWLLAILTWATYLVRPAYLFLIPLWPCLGWWLGGVAMPRPLSALQQSRNCLGFLAASLAPLGIYSGLRWLVLGQAGLVSFAGYNTIGVAMRSLDSDLAQALPDDLRPLAQQLVRSAEDYWQAHPIDPSRTSFDRLDDSYNPSIWRIAVPTAKKVLGEDPERINQTLKRLSIEVLSRRPAAYAQWLTLNGKHAVRLILELAITDAGTLASILGLGIAMSLQIVWPQRRMRLSLEPSDWIRQRGLEWQVIVWLSVSFALAKTLLVMLVEPTIGRYMMAAACLLPCIAGLLVYQVHEALRIDLAADSHTSFH